MDTKSTCGAATCTVTAVQCGAENNWSKADPQYTEAQNIMSRLLVRERRAVERSEQAAQDCLNGKITAEEFSKIVKESQSHGMDITSPDCGWTRYVMGRKLSSAASKNTSTNKRSTAEQFASPDIVIQNIVQELVEEVVLKNSTKPQVGVTLLCHCTFLLIISQPHQRYSSHEPSRAKYPIVLPQVVQDLPADEVDDACGFIYFTVVLNQSRKVE